MSITTFFKGLFWAGLCASVLDDAALRNLNNFKTFPVLLNQRDTSEEVPAERRLADGDVADIARYIVAIQGHLRSAPKGSTKQQCFKRLLATRCSQLLQALEAQYPYGPVDASDLRDIFAGTEAGDSFLTAERLAQLPTALVPVAVVRELMFKNRVQFDSHSREWQAFAAVYAKALVAA